MGRGKYVYSVFLIKGFPFLIVAANLVQKSCLPCPGLVGQKQVTIGVSYVIVGQLEFGVCVHVSGFSRLQRRLYLE